MKRLLIEVPATSANLGPGFDTLGLALDLVDRFEVELDPHTDETTLVSEHADFDPQNNLVCRSYRLWGASHDITLPGARFSLKSEIPVARGLGSSAASIVAGLAAAAGSLEEPATLERIVQLGTQLEGHPDNIAAATLGGLTTAFRDDDCVRALHVVNHLSLGIALLIPDVSLNTGKAREALPESVPLPDAGFNLGRLAYLVTALIWGRWEEIAPAMDDRLHQPYRKSLNPHMDELIAAAREAGACGASLSGSGPTILALSPIDSAQRVADAMSDCAGEHGIRASAIVTEVRKHGVTLHEEKEPATPG